MVLNSMKYGLPERTLNTLMDIFIKYPVIKEVILYGSRAKGKYRNGSDIDLSLKANGAFTHADLLRITGDLDDSDLPYRVDVLVYEDLSNQDLKAHIDRVGKVLYTGAENGGS